jgi:hypothetical protein
MILAGGRAALKTHKEDLAQCIEEALNRELLLEGRLRVVVILINLACFVENKITFFQN